MRETMKAKNANAVINTIIMMSGTAESCCVKEASRTERHIALVMIRSHISLSDAENVKVTTEDDITVARMNECEGHWRSSSVASLLSSSISSMSTRHTKTPKNAKDMRSTVITPSGKLQTPLAGDQ